MAQWNNPAIIIGDRLREMREEKKLSQGDVELAKPDASFWGVKL